MPAVKMLIKQNKKIKPVLFCKLNVNQKKIRLIVLCKKGNSYKLVISSLSFDLINKDNYDLK